jgi:hypothetical protein
MPLLHKLMLPVKIPESAFPLVTQTVRDSTFNWRWYKVPGEKVSVIKLDRYKRKRVRSLHKVGEYITCTIEWGFDGDYFIANQHETKKYLEPYHETREPYEHIREVASDLLCDWFERHIEYY